MAVRLFNVGADGGFKEYVKIPFQAEHEEAILEEWLEKNPDGIVEDGKLLIIGRQVRTNLGSSIDLLALDRQGNTVVIELKRDRTPRDTLAQALEYASFVETLDAEQLEDVLRTYLANDAESLAQYHRVGFRLSPDEAVVFNEGQRLVIVGQRVTPEIRQTASFLRNKGLRVTCLEFSFFQSDAGQMLISIDMTVGEEPVRQGRVRSVPLPPVSQDDFLRALDAYGKPVFASILELAHRNSWPIHWGTKGFSANLNLEGTHVPLCFGYPPDSVFRQSIYTGLMQAGGVRAKIALSEDEVHSLATEATATGLFETAGRELKCVISRDFTEQETAKLLAWLEKVAEVARAHGLRAQTDSR